MLVKHEPEDAPFLTIQEVCDLAAEIDVTIRRPNSQKFLADADVMFYVAHTLKRSGALRQLLALALWTEPKDEELRGILAI